MAEAIALISSFVLQGVFSAPGRSDTIFKPLHAVKLLIFRNKISVIVRRFSRTLFVQSVNSEIPVLSCDRDH